jgi:hypothetical protein
MDDFYAGDDTLYNFNYSDTGEEVQDWQNVNNSGGGGYSDTGEEVQDWQRVNDPGTMEKWQYGNGMWTDPTGKTYDMSYLTPSDQLDIGGKLRKLGSTAANGLVKAFTNPNGSIDWGSVAAAAGGLYGLSQGNRRPEKTGYQGGIPSYEAVRETVANTNDPTRRPGSSGQRYFTQTKYQAPGEAAAAARAAAQEEAAGLEALNKANPTRAERRSATDEAVAKGAESAEVIEGRPASDVIKDKPVRTLATGGILALARGGAPRYLNGASDGMADKIPARIDGGQEARLSHGEFVIPADVVGHLGNGNSEAGANRLYAMMDRIRKARTGTTKQGKQINPDKFLVA